MYGGARQAWIILSRNLKLVKGDLKLRLCKKFVKCKLDDITRNSKEWITNIELIRWDPQTLYVHIENSEMTTHILSFVPK